jgi:putative hydroxymethylpyrimidine transport system substrate-binding protein
VGSAPQEPELTSALRTLGLAAAFVLVLAGAGCGEKSESSDEAPATRSLDLVLDWFPNPDHVAIYEAEARGYFEQVGLEVRTHVPSDPAAPIKQVAAGRADLAISYEPEVLLARERGLPVVSVAALVQRPLTSLIATRKSGVRSVRDLRGKRVGTAGIPYQSAYLKTILARAKVPESSVKETNVGASLLPAMLSGKVDATLGGFWNVEGVELRQRHADPTVIPVDRLGVPDYNELVFVANADRLDDARDDLRLFVSAVARGAEEARKDPAGATRALLDANKDLKEKRARASVRVTIPTLFPRPATRAWGYMDPVAWRNYGGWMVDNGLLKELPDIPRAITNDLLPGEGLK